MLPSHPHTSSSFRNFLAVICSLGSIACTWAETVSPPVAGTPSSRDTAAPASVQIQNTSAAGTQTPPQDKTPAKADHGPEQKPAPASDKTPPEITAKETPQKLPALPQSAAALPPQEKEKGAKENDTSALPEKTDTAAEAHSKILSESDTIGRSVRITFFDKNNAPTNHGQLSSSLEAKTLGATGFASVRFDYAGKKKDEKPILWEFFDTEGKPAVTSLGYSKIAFDFNKDGREVRRSYLGPNDEPINNTYGFSSIKRTFDGTKRLTKEAYYDKDDKLAVNSKLGYAIMNTAYVNNDKEEYELKTYLDAQANPVKINGAYKQVKGLSKSEPPLTIIQSYNNLDDSLSNGPDGYALHFTRPVDNPHNPKEAYLDQNSQPVDGPEGFSKLVMSKEGSGQRYKLQYLDTLGVPVNNSALGWSYKLFRIGKEGEQKDSEFYDKDGKRVFINEFNL